MKAENELTTLQQEVITLHEQMHTVKDSSKKVEMELLNQIKKAEDKVKNYAEQNAFERRDQEKNYEKIKELENLVNSREEYI